MLLRERGPDSFILGCKFVSPSGEISRMMTKAGGKFSTSLLLP